MEVNKVEGGVHVITIDEGKEALRGGHETGKLEVIRTQDSPASKHKNQYRPLLHRSGI
jgi:hypothetical protein